MTSFFNGVAGLDYCYKVFGNFGMWKREELDIKQLLVCGSQAPLSWPWEASLTLWHCSPEGNFLSHVPWKVHHPVCSSCLFSILHEHIRSGHRWMHPPQSDLWSSFSASAYGEARHGGARQLFWALKCHGLLKSGPMVSLARQLPQRCHKLLLCLFSGHMKNVEVMTG